MKPLDTLLEITIYSGVLFAAILLLKACFKSRMSPFLHFAVWGLLVARLMMPVTLESSFHLFVLPDEAQKETIAEQTQPQMPRQDSLPIPDMSNAGEPELRAPGAGPQGQAAIAPAKTPAARRPASVQEILLLVWLAGAGAGILYLLILHRALRAKIRRNAAPPSRRLLALFEEVKGELGVKADVKLICQYEYGTPAMMFPRTVLMPVDALTAMDDEQVKFALRHELTHFRRGDQITSLLLSALNAVYWFNPVVWVAFRQIRADMEAACDSAVVQRLGAGQRSRYASLIVSLFTRPAHRQLALGMAQGIMRKEAERRIRGIFMESRSRRSARAVTMALAAALLLGCFTTACQPTPTDPSVVGKDGEKLEEIIQSTHGAQGAAQTPVPSAYKDSFPGADKAVTIGIDAAVTAPGGDMPVVEVKPRVLSMEQVKAMGDVLLRGAAAYEPQIGMTKADLQKKIVELKKLIADDKALLESCSGDRKTADKVKAEYEEQVASYERLVPAAPESIARRETDWAFHPEAHYMDPVESANDPDTQSGQAFRATGTVEGYHAFIQAGPHYFGFTLGKDLTDNGYYPKWRFADDTPMTMPREEVVAFALDALGRMGVGDMRLVSCNAEGGPRGSGIPENLTPSEALALAASGAPQPSEPAEGQIYSYYMTFVPAHYGVPLLHTGQYVAEEDAYGPPYFYEELRVRVKDGLITTLEWDSPLEEVRVENADVATLSLTQAVDAFKKQMQRAYTLDHLASATVERGDYEQYKGRVESGTVTITDIRLGLMRVRIKDKPDAYRLVPAWMFKGTEQLKIKGEETAIAGMRSNWRDGPYAYAVINALDGSVIDPSLGY
jgi:beta-lactamase regulating signal transducer with metallopeptidase domain